MYTKRQFMLLLMSLAERYLYNHQRAFIMADPLDGPKRWMDHHGFFTSVPCWKH